MFGLASPQSGSGSPGGVAHELRSALFDRFGRSQAEQRIFPQKKSPGDEAGAQVPDRHDRSRFIARSGREETQYK
jgi:hypothetical protein